MGSPTARFRRGAKVALFTLGPDQGETFGSSCEVNSYVSARVRNFLDANGYPLTRQLQEAEVILFNACVLTDRLVDLNEALIRKIMAKYPTKPVLLFGCLAGFVSSLPQDERVLAVPSEETDRLSELFEHDVPMSAVFARRVSKHDYLEYQPRMTCFNNYLLICQGCSNHCSYCNIKLAKGATASRPLASIKEEAAQVLAAGEDTLTLLADDCASYGLDIGTDLPTLVRELLALDPKLKVEIYRMHPARFLRLLPGLLEVVATGRVPYAGVMMQSASPRVLKLMGRDYDPGEVAQALDALKKAGPSLFLTTHFMFNFPTETLEDFRMSLDYMKRFDYSVLLLYGENSRTPAAKLSPRCTTEDLDAKLELARVFLKENPKVQVNISCARPKR